MGSFSTKKTSKMKLIAAFSASVSACGGTINDFQSISSPTWYYGYYGNNLDCTWNIELGNISGFNIVKNLFDVEYRYDCAYDFLKLVDGSGYERNFCGETYESYDSSSGSSSSSSYSSSYSSSSSYRKRRSAGKKPGSKWTPDLVNVNNDGFPERVFIAGGSAVIQFSTDISIRHKGFDFDIERPSRFDIIEFYAGVVIDLSVVEEKWGSRYASRMQKTLNKLQNADTGVSCYEDNIPETAADEGDEITVFDGDDMCKLNGQVNAAINSYARNYACQGRGKVYRQIIRSARKIKKFFNDKNNC